MSQCIAWTDTEGRVVVTYPTPIVPNNPVADHVAMDRAWQTVPEYARAGAIVVDSNALPPRATRAQWRIVDGALTDEIP